MMDWIKRLAIVAVILLVVATPINDIGKYMTASYNLENVTRETAAQAAAAAKSSPGDRNVGGAAAVNYARTKGVEVYGYDQSNGRSTVWTRTGVAGTWVWGPIVAATAHKPFSQWWSQKVPITGKAESLSF
jgi:Flp pilus assembly protein TadG